MKTSLAHLPKRKRDELAYAVQMIRDEFAVEMIILFGIVREGILLHDAGRHELAEPRELTPAEYREKAEGYFQHWYYSANSFLIDYQNATERQDNNIAAFYLHQAVERYYSALLLVLTDYRPKTHDLERLGNLAAAQKPELLEIFPRGRESERQRFELLRRAYVDARYDATYAISRADLQWLTGRVRLLQEPTERLCREKIESF